MREPISKARAAEIEAEERIRAEAQRKIQAERVQRAMPLIVAAVVFGFLAAVFSILSKM